MKKHNGIIGDRLLVFFMILIVVVTLYPFLNVLAKSLNDPLDTVKGGITIVGEL